ncbi:50S ribosomal protein L21e [Candidatus Parvarchaeota archaeon]|nr:50S ribosomal protein L21e [Candidatus Parvarchaeota archaeon]
MVRRSLGKMSKRSRLLGKTPNKLTVNQLFKSFEVGHKVVIDHHVRFSGMPHPRYRGRHGTITGVQGKSYVVSIMDGRSQKNLIIPPVHLKKV